MKRDIRRLLDRYEIFIADIVFVLAPVTGAVAAVSFTAAKTAGFFPDTTTAAEICFDLLCLLYFPIAALARKYVHSAELIDYARLKRVTPILMLFILVQWNAISYIFPFREFWGFAPMFAILLAFYLDSRMILVEIISLSASIAISWILIGDKLLPIRDEAFLMNLILRCVALVIGFICIYLVTLCSEQFKHRQREQVAELDNQNRKLEQFNREMIAFTAEMVEYRDMTSGMHLNRVRELTFALTEKLSELYPEYGLNKDAVKLISEASVLHDVGKIKIPDSILLKPGPLDPEERKMMKKHSEIGAEIVSHMPGGFEGEFLQCCYDICLYHHERYDGKGYPFGLKADEIPLSAQIVSIVDCFDALTSDRPYKSACSAEKALSMINNGECGAFSDKILASLNSVRTFNTEKNEKL